MNANDTAARLKKARAHLVMRQPFFGTLALHLRIVEDATDKTMSTDGESLFYNPAFVDELRSDELEGVVAHEVLHCANKHHVRRGQRDAKQWNIACDYAINRDLLAADFILPASRLYDKRFDGMSAEAIYKALEQEQNQGGQPQQQGQPAGGKSGKGKQGGQQPGQGPGTGHDRGNDPGGCGGIRDAAPAHDANALEKAAAEWDTRVKQAVAVAKARGAGKLPGNLEAIVAEINRPVLDARAILRRFIDQSVSKDYSWTRPNRRYVGSGLILPGFVPDRPNHIVAMVDSSGSMSTRDVANLTGELQAALDEGAADRVTIAYADTKVGIHDTYQPGDIIDLKGAPRGGTSFVQPFQWIAENIPDASAILYMTDMDCGGAWGEQPAAPVLWIVTGGLAEAKRMADAAPFGEPILLAECA